MKKEIIFIFTIIIALILTGCFAGNNVANEDEKITVAVSVVPEGTFVEAVAGDLVNIVTVIPTGNSPANYQPTTLEMQAISDADIYFVMQVPAEEANILPKISDFNEDIILINLRDAVNEKYPLRHMTEHGHDDGEAGEDSETIDPHIWLSPKRAIVMVEIIADKLSEIDEANSSIYQKNAEEYIEKLNNLDVEIKEMIDKMDNKTFMVYHGSYGYFAEDYNLIMISLEADGKSATAQRMQEVIEFAQREGITAIFYQDEFDDNQARVIANEIDGSVMEATPLSADYINGLKEFAKTLSNNGE